MKYKNVTVIEYFFVSLWGMVGILNGATGNSVAAVFVIVILVQCLKEQSSEDLMGAQRNYIKTLEKHIELTKQEADQPCQENEEK
jgi:hypothetical protein